MLCRLVMTLGVMAVCHPSFLPITGSAQHAPEIQTLKTVSGGVTTVQEFETVVAGSMQKAGVTGLSVAILNDGGVVYTRQFGWKDKDAGTLLDGASIFGAGSLSKPVFACLVLALANDGVIDLDRLYASDDGQSWDELLARSETVFFPKGRTVSITFITDTAGVVTGFVVDTGSGRIAARRVR